MPTHRGIKINLVSQWELKVHPEFPHPEGSQTVLYCPDRETGVHQKEFPSADELPASKTDHLLDQHRTASVYIPSCSGARFWIRWTITESAIEDSQWFFFKLFMNGRQITSWGTNAYETSSGQVMRGLFEPSDRWNYKNEGTVYKNMGTEARPFMFAEEGSGSKSVAIDGGLIEVHAFRAFGRQRRLAEPTDFKSQETYGIIMPSGGLLERPQDARFYDWHLKDAKDTPFARFKFRYRSWDSLASSQLIPDDHRRALLSPTPSIMDILGQPLQFKLEDSDSSEGKLSSEVQADKVNLDNSKDGLEEDEETDENDDWEDEVETPEADEDAPPRASVASEISNTPWLTGVFDESPLSSQSHERRTSSGLQYDTAPIRPDPCKFDPVVSRFSNDAAELPRLQVPAVRRKRKDINERPLPEIPQRVSSQRISSQRSNQSRASSASSMFLTPSLRSYVDRSRPSSSEVEAGVAEAVNMQNAIVSGKAKLVDIPSRSPKIEVPTSENNTPSTIVEKSTPININNSLTVPNSFTPPLRTSSATHNPKPLEESPLTEFFNQPNIASITVRKHRRSPGALLSRLSISGSSFRNGSPFKSSSFKDKVQLENEPSAISDTPISVTESEWMCRTPSPVKKKHEVGRYENMWSPSPGIAGKKKHVDNVKVSNGSPATSLGSGMLSRIKKGLELGFNGRYMESPSSTFDGSEENKFRKDIENEVKIKRAQRERSASVANGENLEKRISSKERLRKKGMDWYEQVKNSRDEINDSVEYSKKHSGGMSIPKTEHAEVVDDSKAHSEGFNMSKNERSEVVDGSKWI